jgi:BirA family biotin operon repressor/biotin-[acetyl-CoA-carboxylase] ligase
VVDAARAARATGWTVHAHEVAPSTNDEAARLRDAGAPPRTAVVAAAQTAGRGRGGRAFSSPPGGLYASLLLPARADDLPGPLTAAVAVAAARAIEEAAGLAVGVKWPNDLWVGRRKAGGILLEAAGPGRLVVAGVGVNVRGVPPDLPADVREGTTSLEGEAGRAVEIEALLVALLRSVDRSLEALAERPEGLEADWRRRLLLVGERVRYAFEGRVRRGRLVGVGLREGLRLVDDDEGPVLRRAEHVQDLRPEDGPPFRRT